MYDWRRMTVGERAEALETRKARSRPWHSPPRRYVGGIRRYSISAACYEHSPVIGFSGERLDNFSDRLLETVGTYADKIFAWCVMPNHYHVLVRSEKLRDLLSGLALLHGRTSYVWNGEEGLRGRRVWCNYIDREMRSERQFWATLNYVHHNPVRHEYVDRWQDWPWSSGHRYLEEVGRERRGRFGSGIRRSWVMGEQRGRHAKA